MLTTKNAPINYLNLRINRLDDDFMEVLGRLIQSNQSLEEIDIGFNSFTDKGINKLAHYLVGNMTLKNLKLDENKGITDKSIPNLKNIIKSSRIKDISVLNTSITEQEARNLCFLSLGSLNRMYDSQTKNKDAADDLVHALAEMRLEMDSMKMKMMQQNEEIKHFLEKLVRSTSDTNEILNSIKDEKMDVRKMTYHFFLFGREAGDNVFIKQMSTRYKTLAPLLDKHGYTPRVNRLIKALRELGRCYPDVAEQTFETVLHQLEEQLMREENEKSKWFNFFNSST